MCAPPQTVCPPNGWKSKITALCRHICALRRRRLMGWHRTPAPSGRNLIEYYPGSRTAGVKQLQAVHARPQPISLRRRKSDPPVSVHSVGGAKANLCHRKEAHHLIINSTLSHNIKYMVVYIYRWRDWHDEIDRRRRLRTRKSYRGRSDRTRNSLPAAASTCCWCSPAPVGIDRSGESWYCVVSHSHHLFIIMQILCTRQVWNTQTLKVFNVTPCARRWYDTRLSRLGEYFYYK